MALLSIQGLKKSYVSPAGEKQLIVDVESFELQAGEQVGLKGASGTGKTTFLNLISGVLREDEGTVVVDTQSMSNQPESVRDRLRGKLIGSIFQSFHLLQGLSALENVMMGMYFSQGPEEGRAIEILSRVGLKDHLDHLPRQLSVGQQQRVSLARALAGSPRLILADEPTGNLDPKRAQEAMQLISDLCRESGAGLLVVSHDHELLEILDRVVDLKELNRASREVEV